MISTARNYGTSLDGMQPTIRIDTFVEKKVPESRHADRVADLPFSSCAPLR
jgi:hypothetical protein